MPVLTLGVFGDAGNSFVNGNSFYYKPGWYQLNSLGGTAPVQQAVAAMMHGWGVDELIQLGDTAYNAQSSTNLDLNIGQYYNNYMQPYGNKPDQFAYADANSIYSNGGQGGVQAQPGRLQWPYNLYNFPFGFPNPVTGGPGGSSDGLNHFWAMQGNHDYGTIIGSYNDRNVNQVNFRNEYIGAPLGPDAFDYQNNINTTPPPPGNDDFEKDPKDLSRDKATQKVGSAQQFLDYLPYLQTADDPTSPSYLKPGQVRIGKNDPDGYDGIYYSVDLGSVSDNGVERPLLHVVMLDTPRMNVDAGYYDFNFKSKSQEAKDVSAQFRQTLKAENEFFDPTDPAQIALFSNPESAPAGPSASYQMFEWVKRDLEQSNAVWKVVAGHHTAYHGGAVGEDANSNNFSSPILVKFLAGLKDAAGHPLLDAYWNGHSHAYSRVVEMGADPGGIGAGIPLITTGNGGKDQDALNLVPYGSNVLTPQNWLATFTDAMGATVSNADLNGLTSEYLSLFPANAKPTSVGTSGYYRYDKGNVPPGFVLTDDPGKDGDLKKTYKQTIVVSQANENSLAKSKSFEVTIPQYNSILPASAGQASSVSGLYGYGSGAQYVEADDGYLFMNYRTVVPLDPAIVVLGKQLGLEQSQMQRGSLFFEQWSPVNARVDNVAMFSFDVIIDADNPEGCLDHLQLVQSGAGYLESEIGGSTYQDGTYIMEILGNNAVAPKGFDSADPSRAAVALTFQGGRLVGLEFARDEDGRLRRGTGYRELANAINEANSNESSKKSILVGININLEAQYTFADQAPGQDLYQDWYLIADTQIQSTPLERGSFGGLSLDLAPRVQRARDIIASQPLTTGYSGEGPQVAYAKPQQGAISVKDSLNNVVAGGADFGINNGHVALNLSRLPAPGSLRVDFEGDPFSSYQVNYKAASTSLEISYGDWSHGIAHGPDQSLTFQEDVILNVTRSDALQGSVSFGFSRAADAAPLLLLENADSSSAAALTIERVFTPSGSSSWLASEGQRQGGTGAAQQIAAGSWKPVAIDAAGTRLEAQSITVYGNTAHVDFAGGYQARYSNSGTGTLVPSSQASPLVMTVQRLGERSNGLALYAADPITGGITTQSGATLLPGQQGYLQAALANATAAGLRFDPEDLPDYQAEQVYDALPLDPASNYGILLLRNNNPGDLVSSYSQANAGGQVISQSFAAPGRGLCIGLEDLPTDGTDQDFNDITLLFSSSQFSLL